LEAAAYIIFSPGLENWYSKSGQSGKNPGYATEFKRTNYYYYYIPLTAFFSSTA